MTPDLPIPMMRLEITTIGLLALLVVGAMLFWSILAAFGFRHRTLVTDDSRRRTVKVGFLAGFVACGLAALLALFVVKAYSPVSTQVVQEATPIGRAHVVSQRALPEMKSARVMTEDNSPKTESIPPKIPDDSPKTGDDQAQAGSAERPAWTHETSTGESSRTLVVVQGGRFASEDEAELAAFQAAAGQAAKAFRHLDPSGRGERLAEHFDIVKQHGIAQRHLEMVPHDFGKFTAPMYQLWLQVHLTPELGHRMAEPWRQTVVEQRLWMLGRWSLWFTGVMTLATLAFRLDMTWNGHRRGFVLGSAVAIILGSLFFLG